MLNWNSLHGATRGTWNKLDTWWVLIFCLFSVKVSPCYLFYTSCSTKISIGTNCCDNAADYFSANIPHIRNINTSEQDKDSKKF